jgi:hypothetical protein
MQCCIRVGELLAERAQLARRRQHRHARDRNHQRQPVGAHRVRRQAGERLDGVKWRAESRVKIPTHVLLVHTTAREGDGAAACLHDLPRHKAPLRPVPQPRRCAIRVPKVCGRDRVRPRAGGLVGQGWVVWVAGGDPQLDELARLVDNAMTCATVVTHVDKRDEAVVGRPRVKRAVHGCFEVPALDEREKEEVLLEQRFNGIAESVVPRPCDAASEATGVGRQYRETPQEAKGRRGWRRKVAVLQCANAGNVGAVESLRYGDEARDEVMQNEH